MNFKTGMLYSIGMGSRIGIDGEGFSRNELLDYIRDFQKQFLVNEGKLVSVKLSHCAFLGQEREDGFELSVLAAGDECADGPGSVDQFANDLAIGLRERFLQNEVTLVKNFVNATSITGNSQ